MQSYKLFLRTIIVLMRFQHFERYVLRVSSATSVGCYGVAYAANETANGRETPGRGKNEVPRTNEAKQTLKFDTVIQAKK
ncbi:MAG: hypothetical protein EOP04_22830 [Proteobacteria bacterium]|nr:MAG: hypothetical protein EOP04_22830 [Pseudomonadota bacterium]